MSYVGIVTDTQAESNAQAAGFFEADQDAHGYVANYTRLFAQRPEVLVAWQQLSGAVRGGMDLQRYELATLAAARELRSSYCALAHGELLAGLLDEGAVRGIMRNETDELDPVDAAVVRFAAKVTRGAFRITEEDYAELRALGLSDDELFSIVLAVGVRCFFSTVLDATGTEPDPAFRTALDPATRDALTVGRSIAPS